MNDKTAGAEPAPKKEDEPRSMQQLKDPELKTMYQLISAEMDRRGLLGPTAGKRLAGLAIAELERILTTEATTADAERAKFEAVKFSIIANADIRTSEG